MEQAGMAVASALLRRGEWVHIYPEGSRALSSSPVRPFRPGVGHLVASAFLDSSTSSPGVAAQAQPALAAGGSCRGSAVDTGCSAEPAGSVKWGHLPLVVPFVHAGMEDVCPRRAWVPRIGHSVTVLFGAPISSRDLVMQATDEGWTRAALSAAIALRVEGRVRALQAQLDAHLAQAAGLLLGDLRDGTPLLAALSDAQAHAGVSCSGGDVHGGAGVGMQHAVRGSLGVGSVQSSWASMHAQGCRNSSWARGAHDTWGDLQGNALRAMWHGAASCVADSAAAYRAMCKLAVMDLLNPEHEALLWHPRAAL